MKKTSVVKKKPGRPRKRVDTTPFEINGVVSTPMDSANIFEMVYFNPTMFKKLLGLFKSYDVPEIEMVFKAKTIEMKMHDHLGKTKIYVIIHGEKLNHYYLLEEVRVCVTRENLEKVFGTMDKNHYKVSMMMKQDFKSSLFIVIHDNEYDNEEHYTIEAIHKSEETITWDDYNDDKEYPIKFVLGSQHFKKKINDLRKIGQSLSIQKVGLTPLQISSEDSTSVGFSGIYKDPKKIKLQSKIDTDDILHVSVNIDYIKPFSSSVIGNEILISADKQHNISFTTGMDKIEDSYVTSIKLFTEIKKYK